MPIYKPIHKGDTQMGLFIGCVAFIVMFLLINETRNGTLVYTRPMHTHVWENGICKNCGTKKEDFLRRVGRVDKRTTSHDIRLDGTNPMPPL